MGASLLLGGELTQTILAVAVLDAATRVVERACRLVCHRHRQAFDDCPPLWSLGSASGRWAWRAIDPPRPPRDEGADGFTSRIEPWISRLKKATTTLITPFAACG
jgi:hypothetical protein